MVMGVDYICRGTSSRGMKPSLLLSLRLSYEYTTFDIGFTTLSLVRRAKNVVGHFSDSSMRDRNLVFQLG